MTGPSLRLGPGNKYFLYFDSSETSYDPTKFCLVDQHEQPCRKVVLGPVFIFPLPRKGKLLHATEVFSRVRGHDPERKSI